MDIVVQKYGGTSVGTPQKIKQIAERILKLKSSGKSIVVVVSAMGKSTDSLVAMASQITSDPPRREMDMLLSTGEQISISLLSMAINELGEHAISMTGLQSGIVTDRRYSDAKIREIKTERILKQLRDGKVVIVAGFQGVSKGVEITTLGRGGSDTTAVALAAALHAEICEIYTDVDGVYTVDPNVVPEASKMDYVSYEEMLELASSGAKVLHPRAVEIAMNYNIRVKVKPAHTEGEGTTVTENNMLEKVVVTGITADTDVAKIAIQNVPDRPGTAAEVFGALGKGDINVGLIIQSVGSGSVNDVTIIVKKDDMKKAVDILKGLIPKLKATGVIHESGIAEVSVIGSGISNSPAVAAKMFQTLAKLQINIDLISTSHIRIGCIINKKHVKEALQALHKTFKLDKQKRRAK